MVPWLIHTRKSPLSPESRSATRSSKPNRTSSLEVIINGGGFGVFFRQRFSFEAINGTKHTSHIGVKIFADTGFNTEINNLDATHFRDAIADTILESASAEGRADLRAAIQRQVRVGDVSAYTVTMPNGVLTPI